MERYILPQQEKAALERLRQPFTIDQFVDTDGDRIILGVTNDEAEYRREPYKHLLKSDNMKHAGKHWISQ